MKTIYDAIMEVSVGVLAIIFLGAIVSLELYNEGGALLLIPNGFIYVALITFYVRNSMRGIRKEKKHEKN